MKTIKFLGSEYEASIDGNDIVLWNLDSSIEQEIILRGASDELNRRASREATEYFEDPDEPGSTAQYVDAGLAAEWIEDNIEDYCQEWAEKGGAMEVINYNLN